MERRLIRTSTIEELLSILEKDYILNSTVICVGDVKVIGKG
ncbi:MAG TPA: hypothetical protein PLP64_03910 [Pseudothermotoga sp.]|nr:hypothetical protein [Pseudothermotoga sp.]HOK83353.1 hypothetical protein [Pseudothermotoga sp.]HPP70178.1 hypothetical protein [Pseudothermotoga sp.]